MPVKSVPHFNANGYQKVMLGRFKELHESILVAPQVIFGLTSLIQET
jgi:hypothetical protein